MIHSHHRTQDGPQQQLSSSHVLNTVSKTATIQFHLKRSPCRVSNVHKHLLNTPALDVVPQLGHGTGADGRHMTKKRQKTVPKCSVLWLWCFFLLLCLLPLSLVSIVQIWIYDFFCIVVILFLFLILKSSSSLMEFLKCVFVIYCFL